LLRTEMRSHNNSALKLHIPRMQSRRTHIGAFVQTFCIHGVAFSDIIWEVVFIFPLVYSKALLRIEQ